MMDKLNSLIKIDLNTTFGLSSLKYKLKNKKGRWQYIVFLVAMVSLIPSYVLLIKGLLSVYSGIEYLNQESLFLLMGFLLSQLIIFIFGILYVMSKYYFSNDLNVLVPLPIKPSTIVSAKFVTLLVNEYLTSLPVIAPFIIIFGMKAHVNLLYWLYSIIAFVFLPVIPLVLASIIVMIFMRYTNIKGKKDLLRIVGYIILIVVIIVLQMKLQSLGQKMTQNGGENYLINLMRGKNTLVKKMGLSFPPSIWATFALSQSDKVLGILYLLLFAGVSVIGFVLVVFLSEKLFLGGLIGGGEITAKRANISSAEMDRLLSKSYPPYISIFLKETKMLLRTPIYLLNTLGGVIIVPIAIIVSVMMDKKAAFGSLSIVIEKYPNVITLVSIGIIVLLGAMNCVGCTTFSREGKSFWIARIVPIKIEHQIVGRILSSLFIQFIAIATFLICISFIFTLNVTDILWITILGFIGSVPTTEIGMIIDAMRPLLEWDNPQKAMKENLNVLIAMGLGALYLFLIGVLVYFMITKLGANPIMVYIMLMGIFAISSIAFFIILKNIAEKQFRDIE